MTTFCDVGHSEGRPRHILPPLSLPQLVIADEQILLFGELPGFIFSLHCFLFK